MPVESSQNRVQRRNTVLELEAVSRRREIAILTGLIYGNHHWEDQVSVLDGPYPDGFPLPPDQVPVQVHYDLLAEHITETIPWRVWRVYVEKKVDQIFALRSIAYGFMLTNNGMGHYHLNNRHMFNLADRIKNFVRSTKEAMRNQNSQLNHAFFWLDMAISRVRDATPETENPWKDAMQYMRVEFDFIESNIRQWYSEDVQEPNARDLQVLCDSALIVYWSRDVVQCIDFFFTYLAISSEEVEDIVRRAQGDREEILDILPVTMYYNTLWVEED